MTKTEILRQSRYGRYDIASSSCNNHDSKFVTKNGWITSYALACGYIQKFEDEDFWITMGKMPNTHNALEIAFRPSEDEAIVYQVCHGIADAREVYYNLIKRQLTKERTL